MFAGPNGSGKSTIFHRIESNYSVGYYINPDIIDKQLKEKGQISLSDFGFKRELDGKFNHAVSHHPIAQKARAENLPINLKATKGVIIQTGRTAHSYNAAFLSDFLRTELVTDGKKLSFETVMSHPSKIDFLSTATENGYKTYLYFISTASPDINVERVKMRVKENGHDVEENKIRTRYLRTMDLLFNAVENTYRSYIFDNSGKNAKFICETDNARNIKIHSDSIPHWVNEFLLEKAKSLYSISRA